MSNFPQQPYQSPQPVYSNRPPRGGSNPAKQRLVGPAIFMMVAGVFGILSASGSAMIGMIILGDPDSVLAEMQNNGDDDAFEEFRDMGLTDEEAVQYIGYFYGGVGLVGGLISLLTIFGGIMMLRAKAYWICMFSAILALLPCQPCCIIGLPAGIWALVVLMNVDVKRSF